MHGISNNYRTGVYDGKIAGLYDLEETLGSGHFAVVKLARHVFTGEKVAVKVIDKTKLDEVSTAHLFQEVRCMKLVQHPNVVRLYEVIDTQTKLYLILELGDGGDLYDYIMKHEGGLSENLAREYFRQIVRAISYCHQLHVVHRDLKPENVVFFEKLGIVKLTDFGFSNKFCPGQKLETSCGSLAYSAPEILLGDSYDAPAVDVWSLGVILYMLVCGQPPFQEANDSETLIMIMDCKYSMPAHVSPGCRKLIGMMLVREPEKRATLQVIAEDVWLQEDETKTKTNITSTKIVDQLPEYLPLVSREQVSEEDHSLIIQKMVNGNIATKEEILDALDRNEYNHITATYFLLAERKLRAHRQEQLQKQGPDLVLPVPTNRNSPRFRTQGVKREATSETEENHLLAPTIKPIHLNLPRTPGTDGGGQSGRARKCSIVQEEDDEDEISSCSGREELQPPVNRRGSRSEGRLNIAIQDRIAEADRLTKETTSTTTMLPKTGGIDSISGVTIITDNNSDTKERLGVAGSGLNRRPGDFRPRTAETSKLFLRWKQQGQNDINSELINDNNENKLLSTIRANSIDNNCLVRNDNTDIIATKILTDSSTITIPLKQNQNIIITTPIPKYKTMPSPTRPNSILSTNNCLNEIHEEATDVGSSDTSATTTPRPVVRHTQISNNRPENQNAERTTGGSSTSTTSATTQRRTKFHKTRTASCSSSDASDDDSENRKKRAHKIVDTTKPTPQRRDSHDDSSDSQDPGNTPASGGSSNNTSHFVHINVTQPANNQNSSNRTSSNSTTGRQQKILSSSSLSSSSSTTTTTTTNTAQQLAYRRHRNGRRRAGETRLRESQSLNRITEVQELESVVQLNSVIQNHVSISTMMSTTTTTTTTHHHQHDPPNVIDNTNDGIAENNNHNCHNINNNNNNNNKHINNNNNNLDILCNSNNSSSIMPLSGNKHNNKTQNNKPKGFSARLLQSFKKADTYIFQSTSDNNYSPSNAIPITNHNNNNNNNINNNNNKLMNECTTGEEMYDEDNHPITTYTELSTNKTKITENKTTSSATKKLKMLGRYFQVHKKICIPLPGIFQRGRLYKAQSCGSIVRDKITHLPVQQQQQTTQHQCPDTTSATINYRHSTLFSDKNRILRNCIGSRLLGSDSDINQNNDNILIDNKKSSLIFTLPLNKKKHQQQQQEHHQQDNDIDNFLNEKYSPIATLQHQQQQQQQHHHPAPYSNNHIKQTTIINSNNSGGNNESVQVFSSKC